MCEWVAWVERSGSNVCVLYSKRRVVSRSVGSEEGSGSRAAEVQQFVQGVTAEVCCQHVYECWFPAGELT